MMKKLIVFDLDGTLAESKAPLDDEMAALLTALLGIAKVAVISGADWPQFEKQVLSHIPCDEHLKNLSILPTCGTKFYQYGSAWKKLYSEDFTGRLGGSTSVDVTRPGIDKAYGIRKLRDTLGIGIDEMIFVGDALFPDGNDYPAEKEGALSIQVKNPHESKRVIEAIIACLTDALPSKPLEMPHP